MSRETTLTDCGISTSGMSDLDALVPSVDTYRSAVTMTGPISSVGGPWSWATPGPASAVPTIKAKACLESMV